MLSVHFFRGVFVGISLPFRASTVVEHLLLHFTAMLSQIARFKGLWLPRLTQNVLQRMHTGIATPFGRMLLRP